MKKFFKILLSFIVCLTTIASTTTVFAVNYDIISNELQTELSNMSDDDKTTVWIAFPDVDIQSLKDTMLDFESILEEMINDDDYYDNMDLYKSYEEYVVIKREEARKKMNEQRRAYREAVQKLYNESNKNYLDKCNILEENVVFISGSSPLVIATLTKTEIIKISDLEFVKAIYKCNDVVNNDEPIVVFGDANLDGTISILDATEIQKHLANLVTLSTEQKAVSDTNGDGKIDILDVTQIQKYLAQLIQL